jgi:hypothetical protein
MTEIIGGVRREDDGSVSAYVLVRAPAAAMLYTIEQAEDLAAELARIIAGARDAQRQLQAEGVGGVDLAFAAPAGRA